MSFEIANKYHSLGQFASNKGLADFTSRLSKKYPQLKDLFAVGYSQNVAGIVQELEQFIKDVGPGDIANTAATLAGKIRGQHLIVITDGVTT